MILSDVPARRRSAGYAQRPSPTALRQMVEVAKEAPSGTGGRQPLRCTLLPPYRARLGRRRRVRAEPINGPKGVLTIHGNCRRVIRTKMFRQPRSVTLTDSLMVL